MKNLKQTIKTLAQVPDPATQFFFFIYVMGVTLIVASGVVAYHKASTLITDPVGQWYIAEVKASQIEKTPSYHPLMSVQEKIEFYADMFGVDKNTALRIAKCESGFDPEAENLSGSATGVYQFIRRTWNDYCGGDVKNADHNIICFMQHYPKNPHWWECR